MIVFEKLRFEYAVTYDFVEIPLDNQGFVFIKGLNKDTGDSNGAGKTTPWEVLRHILFGHTLNGTRKGTIAKNDHGYKGELFFRIDQDCYRIVQYVDHGDFGNAIEVYKNDTPVSKHGKMLTQKSIPKEVFNLTEVEFNSAIVLSSKHILIEGSSRDRRDYIGSLFRLDRYDQLHEAFDAKMKLLTKQIEFLLPSEAEFTVLKNQQQEYSEAAYYHLLVETTEQFIVGIRNEIRDLQDQQQTIVRKKTQIEQNLKVFAQIDHHKKQLSFTVVDLHSELNEWMRQQSELTHKAKNLQIRLLNLKNRLRIQNQLDRLPTHNIEVPVLTVQAQKLQEQITLSQNAIKIIAKREKLQQEIESLQKQVTSVNPFNELTEVTKKITETDFQVTAISEELENYSTLEGKSECPTCKQNFDPAHIEAHCQKQLKRLMKLQSLQESLRTTRGQLEEENKRANRIVNLTTELEYLELPPNILTYDELTSAQKAIEYMNQQIRDTSTREVLQQQLNQHSEEMESYDSLQNSVMQMDRQIQNNTKVIKTLQTIVTLEQQISVTPDDYDALETQEKTIEERLQFLYDAQLNLQTYVRKQQQSIREVATIDQKIAALQTKLCELVQLRSTEKTLGVLRKAYGPRGLKVQKYRKIAKTIVHTIPHWVSKMFTETNIHFTYDDEFDDFCIVRQTEAGVKVYDIKRLSNGEKTRLSVCLLFTLANIVSAQKRANMLVLDEVDINMDALGNYLFTNELLPSLRDRYSSVFVISHTKEVQLSNIYDKVWTAVKEKDNSHLELG